MEGTPVSESAKAVVLALAVAVGVLVSLVVALVAGLLAMQEERSWPKALTRAGAAFGGAMALVTGLLALAVGLCG